MKKISLALTCALLLPAAALAADQPSVRIEQPNLHGSRALEPQTGAAVTKDYLQSWDALQTALDQNQPSLLNAYFVGTALDKLTETITEQSQIGVHTRYVARSHDLQIIFYSPEGLSIQLTDTVQYDEQVMDHDKVLASRPIQRRYLVVMTPSEVRWRVRIFQSEPAPQPS